MLDKADLLIKNASEPEMVVLQSREIKSLQLGEQMKLKRKWK
jgi:hypothetical protein